MEKENINTINSNQSVQKKLSEKSAPYLAEISELDSNKADLELFSKEFNVNYRTVRYPKLLAAVAAVGLFFVLWKVIVMPAAPTRNVKQEEKVKEFLEKNKDVKNLLYSLDPSYSETLLKGSVMTEKEEALLEALVRREALRKKLAEEKDKKK